MVATPLCTAAAAAAAVTLLAALVPTPVSGASLRDTPALYKLFMTQANATLAMSTGFDKYPSNGACQSCTNWSYSNYDGWTAGFWPGILFQLYNYSATHPDPAVATPAWWYSAANLFSAALAKNQGNTGTHDVGFMTVPAFGQQYAYTGNATARAILINTANSLCKRFSAIVGCTESWGALNPPDHKFEVIIDNMMNLVRTASTAVPCCFSHLLNTWRSVTGGSAGGHFPTTPCTQRCCICQWTYLLGIARFVCVYYLIDGRCGRRAGAALVGCGNNGQHHIQQHCCVAQSAHGE